MNRKYLSIKQASTILGVTPLTLRNWDKAGRFSPYRNPINNYRYYRVDQIEAFLRQMESSRDRYRPLKIVDIS
ncbi:MAG: MerR family DNA-binding transcriptional regulator [Patescibacteria group bacterium]